MKKVIFDTDIGIDDAMALLFLHYSPEVDLRAIITGFGNASIENTTRNAIFVKELFDISAPVFQGAAHPVGREVLTEYPDFVHGKNGLGDIEIPASKGQVEAMSGAEAIVALARDYPGQLSIVAVGRMTNLSLALDLCPELPELIHEVVVMGGAFGFNGHSGNVTTVAEANIAGDALAADRVFTSGLRTTIVGLDVTHETVAKTGFFDDLRVTAGGAGEFIYSISRCYLDFHERTHGNFHCPVHDASAVAYLLRPDLYTVQEGLVRVTTDGDNAGQTVFAASGDDTDDAGKLCRICTEVDAEAVLQLYATTLALAAD